MRRLDTRVVRVRLREQSCLNIDAASGELLAQLRVLLDSRAHEC